MSFNSVLEKAIIKSQGCQRNWDLSKHIPIEDINTMKTSVTQCASKQNRVFYKCKFITNREIIEKIYEYTERKESTHEHTNPQTLANLVVAFIRDRDPSQGLRTHEARETRNSMNEHHLIKRDEATALGIGVGYLMLTANMLGYSSGCCQCGDFSKVSKILDEKEETLLLMGIGYPQSKKSRLEHHITERMFHSYDKDVIVEDII